CDSLQPPASASSLGEGSSSSVRLPSAIALSHTSRMSWVAPLLLGLLLACWPGVSVLGSVFAWGCGFGVGLGCGAACGACGAGLRCGRGAGCGAGAGSGCFGCAISDAKIAVSTNATGGEHATTGWCGCASWLAHIVADSPSTTANHANAFVPLL